MNDSHASSDWIPVQNAESIESDSDISQTAPEGPSKKRSFYNEMQYKYVTKTENGKRGFGGFRCLLCNKVFHSKCKELLARHRKSFCRGSHETTKGQNETFDRISNKNVYALYNFMPKYVNRNGKKVNVAECKKCNQVLLNSYAFGMRRHYTSCRIKMGKSTINRALSDVLHFKDVGNGMQCMLCSRRFESTDCDDMKAHRRICSVKNDSAHSVSMDSTSSESPKLQPEQSLYRDVQFIDENGEVQTGKECIGCELSFQNTNSKSFQSHQLRCCGTAIDETPTIPDGQAIPYYIELGFMRMRSRNSKDSKDLSSIILYSCRVCKRSVCNTAENEMKSHRNKCKSLTDGEMSMFTKLRYSPKFFILINGRSKPVAECCCCKLRILDWNPKSMKRHRLECKANDPADSLDVSDVEMNESNDDQSPKTNDQPKKRLRLQCSVPFYVESGFIIRMTDKDGEMQKLYQCLTCSSLMKQATTAIFSSHRNECPLTKTVSYKEGGPIPFLTDDMPVQSISFKYHIPMSSNIDVDVKEENEESLSNRIYNHNNDPLAPSSSFSTKSIDRLHRESVKTEVDDDSRTKPCFICSKTSQICSRNLYETRSQYSRRRISDFIQKWLGDNPSKRATSFPSNSDDNNCVCYDCLEKINEYDLLIVTAKQIDKELRETFLLTESMTYTESKEVQDEEWFNEIAGNFKNEEYLDENESTLDPLTGENIENTVSTASAVDNMFYFNETDDDNSKQSEDNFVLTKKDRMFMCSICNETLSSSSMLVEHEHSAEHYIPIDTPSNNRIYSCTKCPGEFSNQIDFNVHIRSHLTHGQVSRNRCKICTYDLKEEASLNEHMALHERMKNRQCVLCSKQLYNRNILKSHVANIHMNELNHQCHICGILVSTPGALLQHTLRLHPDLDSTTHFKCAHCDRAFRVKIDLQRHFRRVHSGIKASICRVDSCRKRFATSTQRNLHELIHDREEQQRRKIHACTIPLCDKKFPFLNQLKRHMEKQHSIMKFPM